MSVSLSVGAHTVPQRALICQYAITTVRVKTHLCGQISSSTPVSCQKPPQLPSSEPAGLHHIFYPPQMTRILTRTPNQKLQSVYNSLQSLLNILVGISLPGTQQKNLTLIESLAQLSQFQCVRSHKKRHYISVKCSLFCVFMRKALLNTSKELLTKCQEALRIV